MKNISKRKILGDNKGVAAIEFAILLPFLLILLYGTYTVAQNVMVSRKVDNTANDLGFILSREGRIANDSANLVRNPPGCTIGTSGCVASCNNINGCTGGGDTLDDLINNLAPMLLYPNADPEKFAVMVSYVGMPVSPSASPNVLRLMWSHARTAASGTGDACEQIGLRARSNPIARTTTVNGTAYNTSTYAEFFNSPTAIERATMVFPGQSFILTTVRYKDDGFASTTTSSSGPSLLGGLPFFGNPNFIRHGTYATRSAWIGDTNGNGRVDSVEFVNDMQYCTTCNVYPSNTVDGASAPLRCASTHNASVRRQCVVNPATSTPRSSTGCRFN